MDDRILVVDDDWMTVDAICTHLKLRGYEVDYFDSCSDALENLRWGYYRLVLLDVMIACEGSFSLDETADGRYTGLKVLELVRQDSDFAHLATSKFALITNWREEPQIEDAAKRFNAVIIRKPISLEAVEGLLS